MLSASLIRRLCDCTLRVRAASDLNEMGPLTVDAISDLIPSDFVVVSLAISHFPAVRFSYANHPGDWNTYASEFLQFAHEDPVYTSRLRLLLDGPACATQFESAADLGKTSLHQTLWRPMGARRFLRYITPGRLSFRLEVARSSDVAFSETDSEVLNAIGRHLDAATEALIHRHSGRLPVNGVLHSTQAFSWLVCDRAGRVLRSTPESAALMRACAEGCVDRIPEAWRQELGRRRRGHPGTPAWRAIGGAPVSVHVAPIRPTHDEYSVGFLQRFGTVGREQACAARFDLTSREAQVLAWLSEGKSNAEIGIILGIGTLTVKKHLESVYHKLGVENRTSAVVVALETGCAHDS